jgi:hypothetical protein
MMTFFIFFLRNLVLKLVALFFFPKYTLKFLKITTKIEKKSEFVCATRIINIKCFTEIKV